MDFSRYEHLVGTLNVNLPEHIPELIRCCENQKFSEWFNNKFCKWTQAVDHSDLNNLFENIEKFYIQNGYVEGSITSESVVQTGFAIYCPTNNLFFWRDGSVESCYEQLYDYKYDASCYCEIAKKTHLNFQWQVVEIEMIRKIKYGNNH